MNNTNIIATEQVKSLPLSNKSIFSMYGEAVKNLSEDCIIQHKIVDWKKIAGMRDKIISDYFGIDYEIVGDTITTKPLILKSQIEDILNK